MSDGQLHWIEGRAAGDVLVGWRDGSTSDALPAGTHVASTVHEYGGGAYLVRGDEVWFVRAEDQRIWRTHHGALCPVTPQPRSSEHRHADLRISPGGLLVCVRERHRTDRVTNELMAVPADGSAAPQVLAEGWDFYSSPRFDRSGSRLAWITWNAPLMPWDGSRLWVSDLHPEGRLGRPTLVAGGDDESVSQPRWTNDGILHFLSDRAGWWNLYRYRADQVEPVLDVRAELGPAAWEFGYATYGFLAGRRIAVTVQRGSETWLGVWHQHHRLERMSLPYTSIKPYLATDGTRIAVIAATPVVPPAVALIDPTSGQVREISARSPVASVGARRPEPMSFPTRDGATAHAVIHAASAVLTGAAPPLLVRAHPGPTANTSLRPDPWVEFFTAHGFAVVEVDYRGSTGYGRDYRTALRGGWGVLDVTDCMDAVEYLGATGCVDPARVAICGSSAGGYTALRAVALSDTFAAATVRHAVIDPDTWRATAPKFQAHHAELLIGSQAGPDTYRERSVLHHAESITVPVLIIHGARDTVTPVAQARRLADALGPRATFIEFAGEGHGLRDPNHVGDALDAELDHLRRGLGTR